MALPTRKYPDTSRVDHPMTRRIVPAGRAGAELFLAVVHARDGIRLAAVADSRRQLVSRLAEYVRRRAVHVLRAEHARHVRALLARGELEAAVEVYFRLVGERWDEEWLVTAAVASDVGTSVAAVLNAVASKPDALLRAREA
jgi:hypothetical protein